MKIAIPLFNNRVSPHFLTSRQLLLVQIHETAMNSSCTINMENIPAVRKKEKVLALGTQALLCGGIDEETKFWLERHGVFVKDNCMGDALDILNVFLNNPKRKPAKDTNKSKF